MLGRPIFKSPLGDLGQAINFQPNRKVVVTEDKMGWEELLHNPSGPQKKGRIYSKYIFTKIEKTVIFTITGSLPWVQVQVKLP